MGQQITKEQRLAGGSAYGQDSATSKEIAALRSELDAMKERVAKLEAKKAK